MRNVVTGTRGQNLAKLVGRFGFSESHATNIIGGTIGATAGYALAGAPGAIAVSGLGWVSRKLAQRLTEKNAVFMEQVLRAGPDARKIITAYNKHTPKAMRDPVELSELLITKDLTGIKELPHTPIVNQAKAIAQRRYAELQGAAFGGVIPPLAKDEDEEDGTIR